MGAPVGQRRQTGDISEMIWSVSEIITELGFFFNVTAATETEIDELLDDYLHAFELEAPEQPGRDALLAQWTEQHGSNGRLVRYHSPGCKHCNHTGFKGRAGLHELMVISRGLRRMVQTGERAESLQRVAMQERMRTLRQDGIDKVMAGLTEPFHQHANQLHVPRLPAIPFYERSQFPWAAALESKTAVIREDLEMAREFQHALMPSGYPEIAPHRISDPLRLSFAHFYQPASTVGGVGVGGGRV